MSERLRNVLNFKIGVRRSRQLPNDVESLQQRLAPRVLSVGIQIVPQEAKQRVADLDRRFKEAILTGNKELAEQLGAELEQKVIEVEKMVTAQRRHAIFLQNQTGVQQRLQSPLPLPSDMLPSGSELETQTKKWGRVGKHFKPVTTALKKIEGLKSPDYSELEKAAQDYLRHSGDEETDDDKTELKRKTCREILERIANFRKMSELQKQREQLPQPPWNVELQSKAMKLECQLLLEQSPPKALGGEDGGSSTSFFLKNFKGENKFIYKPSDGEVDPGFGFKKGGGAYREVMSSVVNNLVQDQTGIDMGVCPTSLVKLDHPQLQGEKKQEGGRTGAVQQLAKSKCNFQYILDPHIPENMDPKEGERIIKAGREILQKVPRGDVERIMLLDFMTLQLDRNSENILVDSDVDPPRLIPIDAGFSLPSRDGFKSMRRNFEANSLLSFMKDHTQHKFSEEMQESIDALRPDDIALGMKQARLEMNRVDPGVDQAIDDEEIEITRRSVMFLKKASKKLSMGQIGEAYGFCFHIVLDASLEEVEAKIDEAIELMLQREPQKQKLIKEYPDFQQRLQGLGWPANNRNVELMHDDYSRLVRIIEEKIWNPEAIKEINDLQDSLIEKADIDLKTMGYKEITKILQEAVLDQDLNLLNKQELVEAAIRNGIQIQDMSNVLPEEKKRIEKANLKKLKDFMDIQQRLERMTILGSIEVDTSNMSFENKKQLVLQKEYEALGGDNAITKIVPLYMIDGFSKKPPVSQVNLEIKLESLKLYKTYLELGGDQEYTRVGGGGPLLKNTLQQLIDGIRLLSTLNTL